MLASIPIKGRLLDPNVHGFLNGPGKAMPLPAYYVEVFHSGKVALYWERCSLCQYNSHWMSIIISIMLCHNVQVGPTKARFLGA